MKRGSSGISPNLVRWESRTPGASCSGQQYVAEATFAGTDACGGCWTSVVADTGIIAGKYMYECWCDSIDDSANFAPEVRIGFINDCREPPVLGGPQTAGFGFSSKGRSFGAQASTGVITIGAIGTGV